MSGQLKEVRERITSVKSTQQITKAMKMVSAAKLRKAQQAITQMRPYADKLNSILTNILSNIEGDAVTSFGQEREVQSALVVIITSNRGLCGAFNSNILKAAAATIKEKLGAQRKAGQLTILPIGKRGNDYVKKHFSDCTVIGDYVELFNDLTFEQVKEIGDEMMNGFKDKKYDVIYVAYSRFKNAAMQFAEIKQFLPVAKLEKTEGASKARADYVFEPSQQELLEHLVPSILQTQFFKYNLDTHASEHGARMTSMDKATENAEDMLKELKISYNKARQEAITKELSEIVGGAAALESS